MQVYRYMHCNYITIHTFCTHMKQRNKLYSTGMKA